MKLISNAGLLVPLMLASSVVGGCTSLGGSVNPAKYETMSCTDLNVALGNVASDISQTAVARGKIVNTSVPNWLWGGARVKTAVANRETARIDRLQQQEDAIVAARKRRCSS